MRQVLGAGALEGRFLRNSQTNEIMTLFWEWGFWRVTKLLFPLQQLLS